MDAQKKIDEIGGDPEKEVDKLPEIRSSTQGNLNSHGESQ